MPATLVTRSSPAGVNRLLVGAEGFLLVALDLGDRPPRRLMALRLGHGEHLCTAAR